MIGSRKVRDSRCLLRASLTVNSYWVNVTVVSLSVASFVCVCGYVLAVPIKRNGMVWLLSVRVRLGLGVGSLTIEQSA